MKSARRSLLYGTESNRIDAEAACTYLQASRVVVEERQLPVGHLVRWKETPVNTAARLVCKKSQRRLVVGLSESILGVERHGCGATLWADHDVQRCGAVAELFKCILLPTERLPDLHFLQAVVF